MSNARIRIIRDLSDANTAGGGNETDGVENRVNDDSHRCVAPPLHYPWEQ
jgi:hypothetical protein